ncbi:MAG TPA: trigger factor [Nitrospirae bacterium]|nr:trigger factor [bacterium BMS3Abin10]GBE38917.1 trigger factor [bacterium BMS3Bbin08]HDH50253.1 trigger factor [Nitrospirota bacterium]HDK41621.1 trigger factor [Nitrospirota bacterium]HDK81472.1 trigger factor [Nitrospirota bacterium]
MLAEILETTPTTRKLKINIPASVIEEEIAGAYGRLRASAKIPGFRTGKVPQAILEKKFSKDIESQVIEKILPEFYSKAVREARIMPVSYPDIDGGTELVKDRPGSNRYKPLSFTVTVEVKPEIKGLNYEGIALKEQPFSVKDEEVDTALKSLRQSRAVLKVFKGPLKKGDMAVIDCDAFINGKEVTDLRSKDHPFILGSQAMPKEFSDNLAGKNKEDSLEFTINFEAGLPNSTIAGKEVLFKVSVKEIKESVLPDLDDGFAKSFNSAGMEELKKNITGNIGKQKKDKINSEYKKEIVEHLVSTHEIEAPGSMVQMELSSLMDEAKQNAMSTGKAVRTDEELRKELEPAAHKNVKVMLILDAVGKKEKIEVSEDDVRQAVEEVATRHNIKPEEVKKLYIAKEGSLEGLKHRLYSGKVLEFLMSKASIETTTD